MSCSFALAAGAPKVGRKAAEQYFLKDADRIAELPSVGEHVLMLSIGQATQSQAYRWNSDDRLDGVAKASYGVTYLYDQWGGLDLAIRLDFNEYNVNEARAVKFSIIPMLTFPMVESNFPLYFGLGAGLGVFFQQVVNESSLSFDYQLVMGARFVNLFSSTGLFIEYGLKNHIHILSDGQLNSTVLTGGLVFSF